MTCTIEYVVNDCLIIIKLTHCFVESVICLSTLEYIALLPNKQNDLQEDDLEIKLCKYVVLFTFNQANGLKQHHNTMAATYQWQSPSQHLLPEESCIVGTNTTPPSQTCTMLPPGPFHVTTLLFHLV